jgi:O-antigen ligase
LTAIVFVIAFFAGCVLALARHPIYGLMTYVSVFYLDPYSRWWSHSIPDLRWSYTAAIVTIAALIVRRQKPKAIRLFNHKIMVGYLLFVAWCAIQTPWALDFDMHMELLNLTAKYALVMALIYLCVDSEQNLKAFLWTHVLGCFFLGWIAYTEYEGGRFEGFGGGAIGEANAGAIQIVTGILVAASMFLVGRTMERVILIVCIPFILNGLVTTISRSGFLALTTAGVIFNLLVHSRHRARVRLLSVLALVLFLMLTGPAYWNRIDTITYAGEDVRGVDTGSGRLDIIGAQWRMFLAYPFGCGHRCTVTLSPEYLPAERLTQGGRSSHNTFMTLLVEQGIPGAMFYFGMIAWTWASVRRLRRDLRSADGALPAYFGATAAILGAVVVGDLFVDYLKLEVRMWFIAIMMVLLNMARERRQTASLTPPIQSNGSTIRPTLG